MRLLVAISFLNRVVYADFWRYIVFLQATSGDVETCPPPMPTVSIRAGTATVRVFETSEFLNCLVPEDGFGLICTGTGGVTFDIIQPSTGDVDPLNIAMGPPAPFSCSGAGLPVSQAYGLGQVCTDGSVDAMTRLNCSPAAAFITVGMASLCFSPCVADVCTESDFFDVTTTVTHGGCQFPDEFGPTPTQAPFTLPVTPTQAPVTLPPATVAPAATPAPVTGPPTPGACGDYLDACVAGSDCCSDRCVTNQCRKTIPETKNKLSEGRGGAGGVAKESGGRRTLFRSVRGQV
jgi:hypothetical protein